MSCDWLEGKPDQKRMIFWALVEKIFFRTSDDGDLLGAGTFTAFADIIGAVGAETEFVLMAMQKGSSLFFIALEGVVSGSG